MDITLILSFLWIHFFVEYITGLSTDNDIRPSRQLIRSIKYSLPFMWFGAYFSVSLIVIHFIICMFMGYVIFLARDIFPSNILPHVLKLMRGLIQMMQITLLYLSYFILNGYDLLGFKYFTF